MARTLLAVICALLPIGARAVGKPQCSEHHDAQSWSVRVDARVETPDGPLDVEDTASGTAGRNGAFRHHVVVRVAGTVRLTADVESTPAGNRYDVTHGPEKRQLSVRQDHRGWGAILDGETLKSFEPVYPEKARRADGKPIAPFVLVDFPVEKLERAARINADPCLKQPVAADFCGECGGAFALHAATGIMRAAAWAMKKGPLFFPGMSLMVLQVQRTQCADCRVSFP